MTADTQTRPDKKPANLYHAEGRTAAKDRLCDYCHQPIRKGEYYQRNTTAVDGKWSSISLHMMCPVRKATKPTKPIPWGLAVITAIALAVAAFWAWVMFAHPGAPQ